MSKRAPRKLEILMGYSRRHLMIGVILGVLTTIVVALGFTLIDFNASNMEQTWGDNPEEINWRRRVDPFSLPKEAIATGWEGWCLAYWQSTSISDCLLQKIQEHKTLSKEVWKPSEIYEYQTGWPLPSLSGQIHTALCEYVKVNNHHELDTEFIYASNGILFLSGSEDGLVFWESGVIAIPFTPVWIGFALDSVFYGVMWLILRIIVGLLRRLIRTSRECCPLCGYNLCGSGTDAGCPECGWNRPEGEGKAGDKE